MKNLNTPKKQMGVGLIEVLVAAVVIAVGLLAVASLQSKLMLSSGQAKTRSEAQVLAERKIEELRNNVTITGYNSLAAGSFSDTVAGTNASYSRGWTVTGGDAPSRKTISVKVSWDSNGDGSITTADEKVNVTSEIAWIDPGKSALYASEGSAGAATAPSPRQRASEDVASEKVLGGAALTISTGTAGTDSTLTLSIPATPENPSGCGTVNLRQVAAGSHFYTLSHSESTCVESGVIAVFLCTTACTHIQNHFGGVALRIAGTVYSTTTNGPDNNGLSHINVAWTSSEVHACFKGAITAETTNGHTHHKMPYECVLAGNCNATAGGATDSDFGANGCYPDADVSDAQINERSVGPGGEFGELGLLGVIDSTGAGDVREQVCFLEDTTNPTSSPILNTSGNEVLNENYLNAVTKRSYISRKIHRNGSNNEQKSEGINRSYTNHNFLIIARGTGTDAKAECNKLAGTSSDGHRIALAPREIVRPLNESSPNAVLPETSYKGDPGTALFLIGNVVDQRTSLRLYIPEVGSCYLNNNLSGGTPTGYVCAVPNSTTTPPSTTSVATINTGIIGGSNEHPDFNPAVFAQCTKATSSASNASICVWTAGFTETLPGSRSCLTPWGASVANGASVTANISKFVLNGSSCPADVTRVCNDGSLSDPQDAIYPSCTVLEAGQCIAPWGSEFVANNASINAFSTASVPFGSTCPSPEIRTCTNGTLSGSATNQSCTVQAGTSCPSLWLSGPDVADGQTVQAVSAASAPFGSTCPAAVTYTCNNGIYSPSASPGTLFQSCTVQAGCLVPNYVGAKINAVPSSWNGSGGSITKLAGTGNYDVATQTPAGGTTIGCSTSITVGP